jgi:hypothetical protein
MGPHQDRDEKDTSAAVIGVSLGDEALFRIGGTSRRADRRVTLASGDVIAFGGAGAAGLSRHRPDQARNSSLLRRGRLSLTLRRVESRRLLIVPLRARRLPVASHSQKKAPGGGRGQKRFERTEQPGGITGYPAKTGAESERGAVPAAQAVFGL